MTDCVPLVAFAPDHALLALQDAAFVLDQVSVADCPKTTVAGLAEMVTVGVGAVTVTLKDPDLVASCCEIALIVAVVALDGAV